MKRRSFLARLLGAVAAATTPGASAQQASVRELLFLGRRAKGLIEGTTVAGLVHLPLAGKVGSFLELDFKVRVPLAPGGADGLMRLETSDYLPPQSCTAKLVLGRVEDPSKVPEDGLRLQGFSLTGPAKVRIRATGVDLRFDESVKGELNLENASDAMPGSPLEFFVLERKDAGAPSLSIDIDGSGRESITVHRDALGLNIWLSSAKSLLGSFLVEPMTFELGKLGEAMELVFRFADTTGKRFAELPLHPTLKDGTVHSGLTLVTERIGLGLGWEDGKKNPGDVQMPPPRPLVLFVPVQTKDPDGPGLRSFALATESSDPLLVRPLERLLLQVRHATASNAEGREEVGGLLLAPPAGMQARAGIANGYRATIANAGPIHVVALEGLGANALSSDARPSSQEPRVTLAPSATSAWIDVVAPDKQEGPAERHSAPVLRLQSDKSGIGVQFVQAGDDFAEGLQGETTYLRGDTRRLLLPLLPIALYSPAAVRKVVQDKLDGSLGEVDLTAPQALHTSRFGQQYAGDTGKAALKLDSLFSNEFGRYLLQPFRVAIDWGLLKLGIARRGVDDKQSKSILLNNFNVSPDGALFAEVAGKLQKQLNGEQLRGVVQQLKGEELFLPIGPVLQALRLNLATAVRMEGLPRVVVKLDTDRTLESLLPQQNAENFGKLMRDLRRNHPHVLQPGWVGLIFIAPTFDLKYDLLRSFVPLQGADRPGSPFAKGSASVGDDQIVLDYLTISPTVDKKPPVVCASLFLQPNSKAPRADAKSPDQLGKRTGEQEIFYRIHKVDLAWTNTEIVSADIRCSLNWKGLFGLDVDPAKSKDAGATAKETVLQLNSVFDKINGLRLVASLGEELQVFPTPLSFGPIKQVYVSAAQVTSTPADQNKWVNSVAISGRVEWQEVMLKGVGSLFGEVSSKSLRFDGLQLSLPRIGTFEGNWLNFSYPSLRFDFSTPAFAFGPLRWAVKGVDFIKPQDSTWKHAVGFERGVGELDIPWPKVDKPDWTFVLRFSVSLGELPELSIGGLGDLKIGFSFGLWTSQIDRRWSPDRVKLWMDDFVADQLNLDLLRFLTVRCKRVFLSLPQPDKPNKLRGLYLADLSIRVLDTPLVEGLYLALVDDQKGRTATLVGYVSEGGPNQRFAKDGDRRAGKEKGGLKIDWLLIARGFNAPSPDVQKSLLALPSPGRVAEQGFGVREQLAGYLTTLETDPAKLISQGPAPWTFGAGFRWLGTDDEPFFVCRFLFVDRQVYGISVSGELFKKWFKEEFRISVIYSKGETPSRDRFTVTVTLPSLFFNAFNFIGGEVTLELFANSDFIWDFGFPHKRRDNSRMWERTIGLIGTTYQGSGGVYLRKERSPSTSASYQRLLIAGGLAIQGGLGAASKQSGGFKVWGTIGFFAVAEGRLLFTGSGNGKHSNQLIAFDLEGACGILIRGGGELDWWIISVRVEVCLMAECAVRLRGGRGRELLEDLNSGQWAKQAINDNADSKIIMHVRCTVTASIAASACIGPKMFRVCRGIRVSIPITVEQQLELAA